MSTLRDIFVDMVPGDRIFLGVIFTSYLTENVLGLQSFVDPMTCMLVFHQYFLSISKKGGGLRKPAGDKRSSPQDSNPMPSGWSRCTSLTCGQGSICENYKLLRTQTKDC